MELFHETPEDLAALPKHHQATHNEKLIITASSLGTVFEWYDFYLYGLLTAITISSAIARPAVAVIWIQLV